MPTRDCVLAFIDQVVSGDHVGAGMPGRTCRGEHVGAIAQFHTKDASMQETPIPGAADATR